MMGTISRRKVALALSFLFALCAGGALGQTLKEVAKFDLPGPGGKRFDYLTIDPDDHYLISAHLAADQTYVIDLTTNKVVATIAQPAEGFHAGIPASRNIPYLSPNPFLAKPCA